MSLPSPVFEDEHVVLYQGDCREILPLLGDVDAVVTDPPYGDTSLAWDRKVDGWQTLIPAVQLWCFGSLRFHLAAREALEEAGWRYGQDVVWEKHNGSGFAADRFKRVHEIAVHWYRGAWGDLYAVAPVESGHRRVRAVRRENGTPHTGEVGSSAYDSTDRITRSVIYVRSEHGRAVHPTQKPPGILRPLITYSVPRGGVVLDPFAGSGSTLLAARETGRRAIGIELYPEYCQRAAERLAAATLDLETAS